MKKFLFPLIGAAIFLGFSPAGARMTVDPTSRILKIPAGGSYAGTLNVRNVASYPITVKVKINDWKYIKPNGEKQSLPAGMGRFSCARWLKVSEQSIRLEPKQAKQVRYILNPPADASGVYVAEVEFASLVPSSEQVKNGVKVNVSFEVGAILIVEIDKTLKPKGVIKEFAPASLIRAERPIDLKATFVNEGNTRIQADGKVAVTSAEGDAVGWIKFPPIKTLPGDQWTVTASWLTSLAPGKYRMVGTFELSSGGILVEEREFEVQ